MGLVLVTGAIGSGKSTTLAAMIDHRNRHRSGHIITIEDPIEFLHAHQRSVVSQREVGTDTPTYADALKSALGQAPDVLFIGEIRDRGTMAAALRAAETGHLVLSALYASNAYRALQRIMNFFPVGVQPTVALQLSEHLLGILTQRLVPRAEGEGSVPAVEVLLSSERVRDLIRKGDVEGVRSAIAVSAHEGIQTFDQALHALYREGIITEATALDAADYPGDLRLQMMTEGAGVSASDIQFAEESAGPEGPVQEDTSPPVPAREGEECEIVDGALAEGRIDRLSAP